MDHAERIQQILKETIQRRASGEELSDEAVLANHPDLADMLREKLQQLALLEGARQQAESEQAAETVSQWSSKESPPVNASSLKYKVGDRLRHYVVEELIGVGGFGSVWRARDLKLDCEVAIKVPKRELSSGDTARFIHEAQVAAQLRKHPNIVSVHEADWEGENAFIVSDFVDGESLDERLTRERLPIDQAVMLVIKLCDALEHAHQQGIVHRDLKPENILLDAYGVPHLTDFGLAMRVSQSTEGGGIAGTVAYMSPEQARGESGQVDGRSDLFSLGIILYELLTGERPFRGNASSILHQILHDEAEKPRSRDARIPKDLETICLQCLVKDPADRYSSAAALSEDLNRYLRHLPIEGGIEGRKDRFDKWRRRNSSILKVSIGLLSVTLLVAVISILVIQQLGLGFQRELADQTQEFLDQMAVAEARDVKNNLLLRFDQVREVRAEILQAAIDELVAWNQLNEAQRKDALNSIRDQLQRPPSLELLQTRLDHFFDRNPNVDPDIRDRTYSSFLCDRFGNQIARSPERETLGKNFAHRSYFTGKDMDDAANAEAVYEWPANHGEPKLSDTFITRVDEDGVIAVSVPLWHEGEFQGVVGVFIELGDLVEDTALPETPGRMLIFDVRHGLGEARLVHHQGREIQKLQTVDLRPYQTDDLSDRHPLDHSRSGAVSRQAIKDFKDPAQDLFWVMMVGRDHSG